MFYTADKGIDRQLVPRFVRSSGVVLPILAVAFIALALFSFSIYHANGQNPDIATPTAAASGPSIASNPSASSASTPNSGSAAQGSGSGSNLQSAATLPVSSTNSAGSGVLGGVPSSGSGTTSSPTSPVSGGMGGGSDSSGSTSGSGAGGSTGGSPAPTVACTNLLTLAQICTACTPSLTLQPGQKALLSTDGTCVAVN